MNTLLILTLLGQVTMNTELGPGALEPLPPAPAQVQQLTPEQLRRIEFNRKKRAFRKAENRKRRQEIVTMRGQERASARRSRLANRMRQTSTLPGQAASARRQTYAMQREAWGRVYGR